MALNFAPSSSSKKTQYEIPSAGGSIAIVYRIIDLGTQQTSYMGESKMTPQVMLVFELPNELTKDGKPMSISAIYTKSLNEKAKLRGVVKALTGMTITDENVKQFNLSDLIGKVCTVDIINKQGKDGINKAYIQNVSTALKGIQVSGMSNEPLIFDLSEFNPDAWGKIPKYWQDRISTTKEFQAISHVVGSEISPITNDEIPF